MSLILRVKKVPHALVDILSLNNSVIELFDLQPSDEQTVDIILASGGKESRHLINGEVLAALGAEGIVINVARGSVIDEAALVEDIDTKKIGGTGLDVFADKPNVPQALLNRGNVVVTPHIGSATHATRAAMAK